MSRGRSSPVWKMPDDDFRKLVASSSTYTAVLKAFGFRNKGWHSTILKRRIAEMGIDCSHFSARTDGVVRYNFEHRIATADMLVENSSCDRGAVKRRILSERLIPNRCAICGCEPVHNGKPLVLVLDHANGVNNDNRRRNLRLLCPNCNSQQPTFAGRRFKRHR